jgi:glucokinase
MYLGIDLGGTQLRVALADGRGRLRGVVRRPTNAQQGREQVIDAIVASVQDVLAAEHVKPTSVQALGIGMPGPLDPVRGLVISPGNLPGFINVPLNRILTQRTGIRSYLHHDAHLAALAEHRHGAAKGKDNLIYVTVSTGIGAGLILDGKLYSGAGGVAGEVGHIVVQPGGPLCSCGNYGCVEALASGTAIAREALLLAAGETASLLHGLERPSAADVVRAARRADPLALQILEAAGTALGIAMGTLVNLFNPDMIVLGGSVINAGRLLLTPMHRSMEASSWKAARRGLRIVKPALGADVGLIGAVEYARLRASHAVEG